MSKYTQQQNTLTHHHTHQPQPTYTLPTTRIISRPTLPQTITHARHLPPTPIHPPPPLHLIKITQKHRYPSLTQVSNPSSTPSTHTNKSPTPNPSHKNNKSKTIPSPKISTPSISTKNYKPKITNKAISSNNHTHTNPIANP